MPTLAEVFPELAAQWDYEKNGNLTPEIVSYGSNKKVWWICPKCGQSYQKKIGNRTAPSKKDAESDKCPVCLGRIIIPGFNSLKAKYSNIIAKEWDFEKNTIDPDTIPPTYRKKMWWICPNGHRYQTLPGNKIYRTGGDCPYCSSQRLCRETSLGSVNPELAKEWHPTKNGDLTPFDVFASTNKYIWWLCPTCGHEWRAKGANRNVGKRGCPHCANSRSSSVPEQLLFRAIRSFFPDAINRHLIGKDEIDVFIPSLNIGFEYDGQRYHNQAKLPKDIAKTKRLIDNGIILYRFRENNCPDISVPECTVIQVSYSPEYSDLEAKLKVLLNQLLPDTAVSLDFDKVINEVRAELDCLPYEKSFAASEERKRREGKTPVALWDYEANAPLTPEMVMPFSEKVVHWICPKNPNHKWDNTVKSVTFGYGCRRCISARRLYDTEDWKEEAKLKHGNKYLYHLVQYIDSETKVDIVCPKHGIFQQIPYEHLNGKGCPYCARQKFHPLESLAVLYPDIAFEWDYEHNKNSGFTPDTIGLDTRHKFWWYCNNGCNHSYQATISQRVNGSGCAVCHGKQVSSDTSLAVLYPEIAKEWCKENDKKPTEVTAGSDYVALWKCPNPNHPPYCQKVQVRSRGCGCVYCNRYGKKHPKDFEDELKDKHPHIKLLSPLTRMSDSLVCQCEECGHIWKPTGNSVLKGKGCPQCRCNK
ncbi:MAG: hypothetical protein K2L34_03690 [Muribaculaceae bacterium]|nr:hypothetical protein [Muribaculaceae bacterium]